MKKMFTCIFVISVLLFVSNAHSHLNLTPFISAEHEKTRNAWVDAYSAQDALYKIMENNYPIFQGAKSAILELISDWNDNETKVAEKKSATIDSVTGALVSLVATIGAKSPPIAYLPSVFSTYQSAKSIGELTSMTLGGDKYLKAINESLSTMDTYRDLLSNTHKQYVPAYGAYLDACVAHLICRPISEGGAQVAYTKKQLDAAVNPAPPTVPLVNGWVHPNDSSSQGKHTVYSKGNWDFENLPYKYPCKGGGGEDDPNDKYRTPSEAFFTHREKCGTAKSFPQLIRESLHTPYIYTTESFIIELNRRSVADGCGDAWYSCDDDVEDKRDEHNPKDCEIMIPKKDGTSYNCPDKFRECMGHKRDHDESTILNRKTVHSDTPDSSNDDDDDDDETENQYVAPEPTPAPAPSYHTCGVHETSVSGTHSAAGCGVSGHYVCDGSDHSLQASCTSTDSNGQSCTVSSFYACQTHTHVYPAAPAISCGRSGCTQTVSSSTEHQVTCAAGHTYWSCGQYANWLFHQHRVVTCKFTSCQQTWQKCTGGAPMCRAASRQGEKCWGLPASP
ncbi:MAG: hypothetical protein OXI67_10190 [Candidatus Poribacteria bacterium]|nr:hypothetical protein [Candidatus Poribacteria bacterium]